jgi:hypothetical protein
VIKALADIKSGKRQDLPRDRSTSEQYYLAVSGFDESIDVAIPILFGKR